MFDINREVSELKNQLSFSKNVGFFFGAGTSCAHGLPNIINLTLTVGDYLKEDFRPTYYSIKENLQTLHPDKTITIESILNFIRQIREITMEKESKSYDGINGAFARELDIEICKAIFKVIKVNEDIADLNSAKKFLAWLNMQNRDYTKEIYTTNYDLIIEKALETTNIPYFDGFVGSYEPFFWQPSIDAFVDKNDLTKNWIRLWKIHGSLNWSWKDHKILRIGKIDDVDKISNELVIYPSKEKYNLSRKQPFIAYFDRLKNYLLSGELLFIINGFSFQDEHINEIILNSLRQNNRLFILIFFYTDNEVEHFFSIASSYLNVSAFGPSKAIINGEIGEWQFRNDNCSDYKCYWDENNGCCLLGDFNNFVSFIIANSNRGQAIEEAINGK